MENRGKLIVSTKATGKEKKTIKILGAILVIVDVFLLLSFDFWGTMGYEYFRSPMIGYIMVFVLIVICGVGPCSDLQV